MDRQRKLPDFLCVGIEKCGTTSLYDLLRQHPAIGLSRNKETHFFNTHWERGLDWYQDKFTHIADTCLRVGEITPAYHRDPNVIPRILQTLGNDVRIILMLREPRQRAYSHYIHDFARHQSVTDLVYKRYLSTTHYQPAVTQYIDAFGKENFLPLIFEEDFLPNQQVAMDMICSFLDIPLITITPVHSNRSCLPVAVISPDCESRIHFAEKDLLVPANSLVIYNGQLETTRIIPSPDPQQIRTVEDNIKQAVTLIPAIKSSIVFEQNIAAELPVLEHLIERNLDIWRRPLGDLRATFSQPPLFIAP